jgi:hypothetical protein
VKFFESTEIHFHQKCLHNNLVRTKDKRVYTFNEIFSFQFFGFCFSECVFSYQAEEQTGNYLNKYTGWRLFQNLYIEDLGAYGRIQGVTFFFLIPPFT